MAAERKDLTGRIFGMLTVLGYSHSNRYAYWRCRCECGKETTVRSSHLLLGAVRSCGCLVGIVNKEKIIYAQGVNFKHGGSKTRLFHIWVNMIQRCENKNYTGFKNYGGCGIKVCSKWHDFTVFREWANKNGYNDKLTIDRIDNNGNYEPSNCRWVTMEIQANNTRKNIFITYKGATRTATQWAREYGIPITTFSRWLNAGENIESILFKKCGKHRGKQHKCEVCGISFISHSHKSKYCSDECSRIGENKAQQARRIKKRVA